MTHQKIKSNEEKLRVCCYIKRKEPLKQMDVYALSGKKVSFPSFPFSVY